MSIKAKIKISGEYCEFIYTEGLSPDNEKTFVVEIITESFKKVVTKIWIWEEGKNGYGTFPESVIINDIADKIARYLIKL